MSEVVAEQEQPRALVMHEGAMSPARILDIIDAGVNRGIPVEALERLQAILERAEDRSRAAEFAQAVAAFQAKCPPIRKNAKAKIATKSGAQFEYTYAELDFIAREIAPLLQEVGLSYSWDSETKDKLLTCTCILRHTNGHSERANFTCPVESLMGATEQQKHGAALTYARRQSLIQVLGLVTGDPDLDGASPERVTEEQVMALKDLVAELGVDRARLLQYLGVDSFEGIPASNYGATVATIKSVAAQRARRAERKEAAK